jgi:hypothetical protein
MLIGSPGTRKSTAIKMMRQILQQAGYTTIAADKTTKEKFLLDLSGEETEGTANSNILEQNLWGTSDEPRECFIMADEFNDFIGNGNIEFISLLGTLWDYSGVYSNRVKNSKSVNINNPTVSILGGNTPVGFSTAFPPEIIGQGFFSRLLLIYGEPSGRRIAFPTPPPIEETTGLVQRLQAIKLTAVGEAAMTTGARKLLEHIYHNWHGVNDVRFESYSNRRFTHLLKLALICSAANYDHNFNHKITEQSVLYANTILSYTEHFMPKALGEFGKAKNSDVSHKIIQLLDSSHKILPLKEIWKHVCNDLEKINDLAELLRNLTTAEKIQPVHGGFLPNKKLVQVSNKLEGVVDYSLLTEEERSKLDGQETKTN